MKTFYIHQKILCGVLLFGHTYMRFLEKKYKKFQLQ